ncbi:hypothetical protein GFW62_23230 [Salmonella enterica]|nr:hypothetical protein [Salmonella enterica]
MLGGADNLNGELLSYIIGADTRGETIFETRLKPTVSIDPAAAAVHGIRDDELADAPAWPDIAPQLQHYIGRLHIRMRPITDSHSVPIIDSQSCRSAIRIQYRSAVI